MLSCLHSFCEKCLIEGIGKSNEFECPECGDITIVDDVSALPIDYTKAVNSTRSLSSTCDMCSSKEQPEAYCVDCSATMCSFCSRSHKRQRITASHEMECLDLMPIYCQIHPDEKVSLYCDNCEILSCRDCAISVHRGHSCNFIADVENEFREEFVEKIDESEQKMMSLNDYLEDTREKKQEVNAEAQRLIDEITKFTNNYIKQIQAHCDSLTNRVNVNRQKKLTSIEETIASIEQLEQDTEYALDISRTASKMEGSFMLSMMDHMTSRLCSLDKRNDELFTDDRAPQLRFDRSVRHNAKHDLVICGDLYVQSRATSCHLLSHRVTSRQLTVNKAYEINIDCSDSIDPVSKGDVNVEFASGTINGKSKIIEKKNGIISVRFLGPRPGTYNLSVRVDGEEINGTPLEIHFGQNQRQDLNESNPHESSFVSQTRPGRHRFQSGQSTESASTFNNQPPAPTIQTTDTLQSVTL